MGLALAFVAVGAAGVAYVSSQSAHDARETAAVDAQHSAELAAKQLGDGVAVLQATVAQLSTTPGIEKALTKPEECALSFTGPNGAEAGHIDVLTRGGAVLCTSSAVKPGADPAGYGDATWLEGAAAGPVFRAPVSDPAGGGPAILSAAPFEGGLVAGFLTLEPTGPQLARLFDGGHPTEFLILTKDRRVIARSVQPKRWVGRTLQPSAVPSGSGLIAEDDLEGVPRIYRSSAIKGTDWQLWVGNDEASALGTAHTLRDRQLLIIGIGVALTLLATLLVYRRVARPIARLDRAVAQKSPADLVPVPVEGPTEIARLAESVNGFITSIQDQLRLRGHAETALETAARDYRQLFAHSPLPMWIHAPDSGTILAVNEAALTAYGYSEKAFLALTAGDVQVSSTEHRRSDGSPMSVRIVEDTVQFEGRSARVVVAEDVGERERLERQFQQGQRMESIGRLAGGIAHDFNNLLAAVVGYSDLLLHTLPVGDANREEVQQIKDAGERGVGLTRQLLTFARGHELQKETFEVNAVILELEPMLRQLLPSDIELVVELDPGAGSVDADRSQVEQVIVNLAVNAGHAMPGGGRLHITTAEGVLEQRRGAPSPAAKIELRDTGIGMDDATLAQIFEPFFTTRTGGQGTGLGLATVYRVVQQSGGTVAATSELGVGTTFTVALPTSAPVAHERDSTESRTPGVLRHKRVLVVDDDAAVRTLARRMLDVHGFELLEAADGDEALALSEGQPADALDLIITDSVVPGPGGMELARQVRLRHPGVQVLIMSGYDEQAALGADPDMGASFIAKPFTREQLETTLGKLDDTEGRKR